MPRLKQQRYRGSVTQNVSVRMRAKEKSRFGVLLRFGALGGSILIIFLLSAWLWHIGWPQRQTEHLLSAGLHATQKAQFDVKDIIVEGRERVNKQALFEALGTVAGAPILDFNPQLAQEHIAKLPWVASVIVERRLPDTLFVRLTERVPLARWQHEDRTVVIDSTGSELQEAKLDQFQQLPLVVGADAAGQAQDLLTTLKDFPAVQQKMVAAVRVSQRRWDLHLQPKVIARLPETNITPALSRLSDLITDQKILDRDIVAIDLRDPTRMFIEPGRSSSTPTEPKARL